MSVARRTTSPTRAADGAWPAWLWWLILAVACVDAVWLTVTPITLSSSSIATIAGLCLCALGGRWLTQNVTFPPNVHTIIAGGTMLLAAWPALRIFNHLTMSTGFPLADSSLAAWDELIGFDWATYVKTIEASPTGIRLMAVTYRSLDSYSVILFLILALGSDPARRCSEFMKLFLLTALACIVMGMFLPALSASVYYDLPAETWQHIPPKLGAYHLPALEDLRANRAAVLHLDQLVGLVTFPSFHTAMGVLAIYCARHYLGLLIVSLVVNLTMIASTPLFGAHYGIDVIGGAAVAVAAILVVRMRPLVRLSGGEALRPALVLTRGGV